MYFCDTVYCQTSVESEVFGSGTVLHSFLEGVRTARGKRVQVSLPRLTIQVWCKMGENICCQIDLFSPDHPRVDDPS